jgi:hypothetical protein
MLPAVNLFSLFGTWAAEATQSVSAIPRRPFTKTVFPTYMSSIALPLFLTDCFSERILRVVILTNCPL